MELPVFFKSVIDSDPAPIVICDIKHIIVYMNPASIKRYSKRGGAALIGKSLLDCHNSDSNEKIIRVVDWFMADTENNRIFTFHNPKDNADVYMMALRNENKELIGYYEKHELRTLENSPVYNYS
ncbi:MAG: PAS domain-containing protein [Ruminococcus sp.]|nr:PAS domain-containing protein [Ruminococcus sp.]